LGLVGEVNFLGRCRGGRHGDSRFRYSKIRLYCNCGVVHGGVSTLWKLSLGHFVAVGVVARKLLHHFVALAECWYE
jgi:hypothetical protein